MPKIDLTGQRFGRLLVLREDTEPYLSPGGKPTRRWICRCDCGREVSVLQNALTASHHGTRSCGCARAEKSTAQMTDLTGHRFGRLTAVRKAPLPKRAKNGAITGWLCRCDCGREVILPTRYLTSGASLSCGCLLVDTARQKVTEDNVTGLYDGTRISAISPEREANQNSVTGVKGVYLHAKKCSSHHWEEHFLFLSAVKSVHDADVEAREDRAERLHNLVHDRPDLRLVPPSDCVGKLTAAVKLHDG